MNAHYQLLQEKESKLLIQYAELEERINDLVREREAVTAKLDKIKTEIIEELDKHIAKVRS